MVKKEEERGIRVSLKVTLSRETERRLHDFCVQCKVDPSQVVENALIEYFHEGDVSH